MGCSSLISSWLAVATSFMVSMMSLLVWGWTDYAHYVYSAGFIRILARFIDWTYVRLKMILNGSCLNQIFLLLVWTSLVVGCPWYSNEQPSLINELIDTRTKSKPRALWRDLIPSHHCMINSTFHCSNHYLNWRGILSIITRGVQFPLFLLPLVFLYLLESPVLYSLQPLPLRQCLRIVYLTSLAGTSTKQTFLVHLIAQLLNLYRQGKGIMID